MPDCSPQADNAPQHTCRNCGAVHRGRFCSECGERKLEPARDHSFRWLAEQLLEGLLQLDAKLPRTLGALLVPGRLTREQLDGRRVRYLGPLQLFLLVGVVFYLCFSHAYASPVASLSAAYAGGNWFGNVLHFDIDAVIARRAAELNSTPAVQAQRVFDRAGQESKVFLGLLVPVLALGLYGLCGRRERRFVPHLIAATHLFTVFLVFDLVFLWAWRLLGASGITYGMFVPLVGAYAVFLVAALRRIHGFGWLGASLRAVPWLGLFFVAVIVYQQIVTVVAACIV